MLLYLYKPLHRTVITPSYKITACCPVLEYRIKKNTLFRLMIQYLIMKRLLEQKAGAYWAYLGILM